MGFEDKIRKVVPYAPGEQPKETGVIKLNTNENPYPPSPAVRAAMERFDADQFRLYPDPAASGLVHAIAKTCGLRESQVFVGVGSDDVLAMCFLTFFNAEQPILFPDITYSFYDVWAELFRIPYRQLPLSESFMIIPEDYERENGGIVFPNPNAPTGRLMELSDIERIVRANPDSVVIIDEAYIDFGGQTALPLLQKYENVVVVQTFSKSRSAAGLRIGYAMANERLIRCLNDVKYSFNSYTMDRMTIELGTAILEDGEYFRRTCAKIAATRERAAAELRGLGFVLDDSSANFLFVTHPDADARDIFEYLRGRKIYVRWWDKPRIRNYLRITVGSDGEMAALAAALREFFNDYVRKGEPASK